MVNSRGCGDLILHMEDPNYRVERVWPMEGREGVKRRVNREEDYE